MVKVTWYGHACFLFEFSGVKILVDPFISENPLSPIKVDELGKVDIILATHDHADHLGDLVYLANKFNSITVGVYEFANWLSKKGVKNVIAANIGGSVHVLENVTVKIVPAVHTSSIGAPVGYLISKNNEHVYHAGDTCYHPYMKLIGEMYSLKLACLPIGGHFTMDVDESVYATVDLKPKYVIPMHFNTFDVIKADVKRFKKLIEEKTYSKPLILKPGEEIEI